MQSFWTAKHQLDIAYGPGNVTLVDRDDWWMSFAVLRESSIVGSCVKRMQDSIALKMMEAEGESPYPDLDEYLLSKHMQPLLPYALRMIIAVGFAVFSRGRIPTDGRKWDSWMRRHAHERVESAQAASRLLYYQGEERDVEPDFTTSLTVPLTVDPFFYDSYICRDPLGNTHVHVVPKMDVWMMTRGHTPPQLFVIEVEEFKPDFTTGELQSPLKRALVPFRNLALMQAISVQAAYARAYQVLVVQHDKDQNTGALTDTGLRTLIGDPEIGDNEKLARVEAMNERQDLMTRERARVSDEMNDKVAGSARAFERPAHLGAVHLQSNAEQVMSLAPGMTTSGHQPTMAQAPGNVGELQQLFDQLVCQSLGVPTSVATSGMNVARNAHVAADTDMQVFVNTVREMARTLEEAMMQIYVQTQGRELDGVRIPTHTFVDLGLMEGMWRIGGIEFGEFLEAFSRSTGHNIKNLEQRKPRPGVLASPGGEGGAGPLLPRST